MMQNYKNYLIILLFTFIIICPIGSVNQCKKEENGQNTKDEMVHHSDFQEALKLAEEKDKPLFIALIADWCYYCNLLKDFVFTDETVIDKSNHFINVFLDMDIPANNEIMQTYFKNTPQIPLPTILFLTPDTSEIDRICGFVNNNELIDMMDNVLEGEGTFLSIKQAFYNDPKDFELFEQYRKMLDQRNDLESLQKAYETLLWANDQNEKNHSEWLFEYAIISHQLEDYEISNNALSELSNQHPQNPFINEAFFYRASNHYHLNELQKAREYLNKVEDETLNYQLRFKYNDLKLDLQANAN